MSTRKRKPSSMAKVKGRGLGAKMRRKTKSSQPGARRPSRFSQWFRAIRLSPDPKTVNRVWLVVFGVWIVLVSGLLSRVSGTPGVIQALELRSLLTQKENEAHRLELKISELNREREALANDSRRQEREIRRVLGYVAEDDLVFPFVGR